nr:hypothetical protein [Gemmatimonadales bacterium]
MTSQTLALHPDNPHYFLFRGKPLVVVTSAEHYGAVMNRPFDYREYLTGLRDDGMNMTRIFAGGYVEYEGAFRIERNTLAPALGDYLCPWKRTSTPGYANGGSRFDLYAWDEEYFARLSDFIETAAGYGIVVEVCFFCPFYDEGVWALSPWRAGNNVNGLGDLP